jgi:hypothetical protein
VFNNLFFRTKFIFYKIIIKIDVLEKWLSRIKPKKIGRVAKGKKTHTNIRKEMLQLYLKTK